MRASHNSASNLFGRLTSLTVEEGSRRIENFCTESLACLLINSQEFQKRFFTLLNYSGPVTGFEFHTQEFCRYEEQTGQSGKKGYFDLVAISHSARVLIVIEVKTSEGFRPGQLAQYRAS